MFTIDMKDGRIFPLLNLGSIRALASARGSVVTQKKKKKKKARSLEGPKGPRVAETCESEGPKGPRTS